MLEYFNPFRGINSTHVLQTSFLEKCLDTFLVFSGLKWPFSKNEKEMHVGLLDYPFFIIGLVVWLAKLFLPKGLGYLLSGLVLIVYALLAIALTLAVSPLILIVHLTCLFTNWCNEAPKPTPSKAPVAEKLSHQDESQKGIPTTLENNPTSTMTTNTENYQGTTPNACVDFVEYSRAFMCFGELPKHREKDVVYFVKTEEGIKFYPVPNTNKFKIVDQKLFLSSCLHLGKPLEFPTNKSDKPIEIEVNQIQDLLSMYGYQRLTFHPPMFPNQKPVTHDTSSPPTADTPYPQHIT